MEPPVKTAAIVLLSTLSMAPLVRAESAHSSDLLPRGQIAEQARHAYAEAVNACDGRGDIDSPAFTACLKDAVLKADAEVSAAYADALRIMVPQRRDELAKAQETWLAFYRRNCDMEKPLAMSAYYDCIIRMAIERRIELRHRIGD
jgi:uncharacterized protein YecT (DUF1311 family)